MGWWERVFEVLLDAMGFPPDRTGIDCMPDPDGKVFCRDKMSDVFFELTQDPDEVLTDARINKALDTWEGMLKNLSKYRQRPCE